MQQAAVRRGPESIPRVIGPIRVVHNVPIWLERSETWLWQQLMGLPRNVVSHIAAERAKNTTEFPFENVHVLRERGTIPFVFEKGLRKLGIRSHGFVLDIVRLYDANVLHSHFGPTAWSVCRAAHRAGVPHVVTFYGHDVDRVPQSDCRWRVRYHELFNSARFVLCEGPRMVDAITALGCDPTKIRLHRIGVPLDELPFRPRTLGDGPLRVLMAAGFREKKGIPYAIDSLARLAQYHHVTATLVGAGDGTPASRAEETRIVKAIEDAGCEIRQTGSIPHSALVEEMYRHHVLLSPSVTAEDGDTEGGAPVTVIEAAATGMPVVATRHCDLPDVLVEAQHLLATERDVDGLVDRLRWLVEHPWNAFLGRVRTHIVSEHDAVRQGHRLATMYEELAT